MIAWLWAVGYASVIALAVLRTRAKSPRAASAAGPVRVLVVRPCAGDDPWLAAALESTGGTRTRHNLEVVLCVAHAEDAAWPVLSRTADALVARGIAASAMVAASAAPNAKCGQLAVVTEGASHDVIVGVDADVDLTGFELDRLIDPLLGAGGPAAVYAPPVEVAEPRALADRASQGVLDASLHAFGLLAGLDPRGLVGKLFAVRRDRLDALGGFAALADHLGEDMELARRLRAQGVHTGLVPTPARALVSGRSWRAVIARYARWIVVIRAQRPALLLGYPLLFFPTVGIVVVALLERAPGAAVLALVTRVAVAVAARRRSQVAVMPGLLRAIVLSDAVLMAAWVLALLRPTVEWRGRTLRVHRGGRTSVVE